MEKNLKSKQREGKQRKESIASLKKLFCNRIIKKYYEKSNTGRLGVTKTEGKEN